MIGTLRSLPHSIAIAARKFLVPFPGAFDDGVERLELRFPTKLALDLFRGSDETRWVARTARLFDDVDLAAGYFSGRVDHFTDTGTPTRPQIIEITFLGPEREITFTFLIWPVPIFSRSGPRKVIS